MDALYEGWHVATPGQCLAAALRALAVRIKGADAIRQDVLDIADELDKGLAVDGIYKTH
jgi:hypothetical protein